MSQIGHVRDPRVTSSGSDQDEKQPKPQPRKSVKKNAGWGHMLNKIEDFFQICDSEGKGFITRTDMRKRSNSMKKSSRKHRLSAASIKHTERKPSVKKEVDEEEVTQRSNRKTTSLANSQRSPFAAGDDGKPEVDVQSQKVSGDSDGVNDRGDVEDAPPDGWPLRRVISIEEDHLPHLLQGDPHLLLHQLSEEEEERAGEEEGQGDLEMSSLYPSNASLASADSPPPVRVKKPSNNTVKNKPVILR